MAVDNLVEGLANAGVKPLRIAHEGKVKASIQEHTLQFKLDKHILKPKLDSLLNIAQTVQDKILDLQTDIKNFKGESKSLVERLRNMRRAMIQKERQSVVLNLKIWMLRQRMLHDVVNQSDVVRWTLIIVFFW